MMNFISSLVIGAAVTIGGWFGLHHAAPLPPASVAEVSPVFGAFNPVGGGTYRLQSSIGLSNTSVALSSFKEPISNIPFTMAYMGSSVGYGTLDPQSSRSEFISFTGITQNANGTALLTGVTRGLTRTPAGSLCTASTTLTQAHSGQSIFILSDSPCLFAEYYVLRNNATSTGILTFTSTTQPLYDTNPTFSNPLALIDKFYADALSIVGAPTSTEVTMGVSRLATFGQVGTGIASSTSGAPYVIENKFASSTYNGSTVFQGEIPALRSTKDIDPNFIATSTGNNYNWAGMHAFSATTTVSGTGGFLNTASTTLTATTTVLGKFVSNTNIASFTSGSTTPSWPMAFVTATTTGTVFPANATNASTTNNFAGFSVQNGTIGQPILIQTAGVVSGFTGLTAGSLYYLANGTQGTISTTAGTNPVLVGQAVSTTQLLVNATRNLSYNIITGATSAAGTGNNAQTTATATCPTGQIVVGGGGVFSAAQPIWIQQSYPSASNIWTVVFGASSTGGGSGGNVNAYAVCINP